MHAAHRPLDPQLRDLAGAHPRLVDTAGRPTGLELTRWLAAGGMAAVFLAERDEAAPASDLSKVAPRRLAVKVLLPSMVDEAERLNVSGAHLLARETAALGRMMER